MLTLVVLIVAFVSLVAAPSKKRLLWLPLVVPALFVLMQTQSRSALLGLAVASMLFVLVRGISLRFLIAGPGNFFPRSIHSPINPCLHEDDLAILF